MKVAKSYDGCLEFDNGVTIESFHENDCCEDNYLDFEQFVVGAEFPTMSAEELCKNLVIRPDGLILKDSEGIPKWAQARSEQNGYYSDSVGVRVDDSDNTYILIPKDLLDKKPKWPNSLYYFREAEVMGDFDPAWREAAYSTDIVWANPKNRSTIPAKWAERNDKEGK